LACLRSLFMLTVSVSPPLYICMSVCST
jgi:hypothetical protein